LLLKTATPWKSTQNNRRLKSAVTWKQQVFVA
jgi:hypothetical protein